MTDRRVKTITKGFENSRNSMSIVSDRVTRQESPGTERKVKKKTPMNALSLIPQNQNISLFILLSKPVNGINYHKLPDKG